MHSPSRKTNRHTTKHSSANRTSDELAKYVRFGTEDHEAHVEWKTQVCAGVPSQDQCGESAVIAAVESARRDEFLQKVYLGSGARRADRRRRVRLRRLPHLPAM